MSQCIRVCGYYRMSDDHQEASIPEQQQWARSAIQAHNIELVREFQDAGIPGDELLTRPDFQKLIAFCEQQQQQQGTPIDAVVVWDADRLSRASSLRTAVPLVRLMDAGTTRILSQEGWTDLDDDTERVLFNLKQDLSRAAYSKSIAKNVTRSCLDRVKQGKWVGGQPPYSCIVGPDGHLGLGDPVMVEAVRWIFEVYSTSLTSLRRIAEALESRGVPPPKPRKGCVPRWSARGVYGILHNPAYLGHIYWNRKRVGKYSAVSNGVVINHKPIRTKDGKIKVCRNKPEDIVVCENAHPAIITPEVFAAAQQRLAMNAPKFAAGPQARRPGHWLFSGLLICQDCGQPMYAHTVKVTKGGRTYRYDTYLCSSYHDRGRHGCHRNSIREKPLLDAIAATIEDQLANPDYLKQLEACIAQRQSEGLEDHAARMTALRSRLDDLDRDISQGQRNVLLAPASLLPGLMAMLDGWKAEREKLAQELAKLQQAVQSRLDDQRNTAQVLKQLQRFSKLLRRGKPEQVAQIIQGAVDKLELHFAHEKQGRDFLRRGVQGRERGRTVRRGLWRWVSCRKALCSLALTAPTFRRRISPSVHPHPRS